LAVFVLYNYLRNGVSVEDCVIENTDPPSQFSYVTTFRNSVASEEAVSVREKYRQYFENWKLSEEEGQSKNNVINKQHIDLEMSVRATSLHTERRSA
jgi:hypothetical protein